MITLKLTLQWGDADHVKPAPNLENFATLLPARELAADICGITTWTPNRQAVRKQLLRSVTCLRPQPCIIRVALPVVRAGVLLTMELIAFIDNLYPFSCP
jgi:hypothetical protein